MGEPESSTAATRPDFSAEKRAAAHAARLRARRGWHRAGAVSVVAWVEANSITPSLRHAPWCRVARSLVSLAPGSAVASRRIPAGRASRRLPHCGRGVRSRSTIGSLGIVLQGMRIGSVGSSSSCISLISLRRSRSPLTGRQCRPGLGCRPTTVGRTPSRRRRHGPAGPAVHQQTAQVEQTSRISLLRLRSSISMGTATSGQTAWACGGGGRASAHERNTPSHPPARCSLRATVSAKCLVGAPRGGADAAQTR